SADTTVPGSCSNGRALAKGWGMSVSPDGAFLYQATDGATNAGLAIYARGIAPVCQSASAAAPHGSATAVTLSCSDANGDAITRAIASAPAHGTLGAVNNGAGT